MKQQLVGRRCLAPSNSSLTLVLQYVDALRLGDIGLFKEIEAESGDWWFPTLDRGAGACIHFAADHGQASFLTLCLAGCTTAG